VTDRSRPGRPALHPVPFDLTPAVVVSPPEMNGKAVAMLIEEVEKRTRVCWRQSTTWPEEATPVIALGPTSDLPAFAGPYAADLATSRGEPEGFRIQTIEDRAAPAVLIAGHDARGVLFGVGRLLRELRMSRDRVALPGVFSFDTAPRTTRTTLRGHQLGYRPKTNSYDGWTLAMWEQYIRDLVVFGANAVELIPPRSDDDADSPHFPLPPMEMMVGMSQVPGPA
jgi:hypothetical protein